MPINLSVLLKLDQGRALLGFTASTGLTWEKHDLLSWQCCEEPTCNVSGDKEEVGTTRNETQQQ